MLGCLLQAGKQGKVGRHRRYEGILPFCGASVYIAGSLCGKYPCSAYIGLHYMAVVIFQVLLVPDTRRSSCCSCVHAMLPSEELRMCLGKWQEP